MMVLKLCYAEGLHFGPYASGGSLSTGSGLGVSNAVRARNLGLEWSGVTRGGRARERGFSRAGLCGKGREEK